MKLIRCTLYMALIGALSFLLGRFMPPSWFHEDHFPYRDYPWEHSGTIYNDVFHIRKWQNRVPDMSKIFPKMMQEKKISRDFRQELPLMIKETCIAEFIHVLLCLAGLHIMDIWPGVVGLILTVVYIAGNLAFVLIQRYNRPRLRSLQAKVACR